MNKRVMQLLWRKAKAMEASELRKEEGLALRSLVGYAYRKHPSDEE
ncbi:hypothetical protein Krac_6577 [Ktedonobacter racemifer DSM 44963]|uniref:Uncharacterized protein n=1 Tax=Ktedonobacter racemifer DSM 44963 TaxID=485913 RepID=D6TVG4_KTERA|nr:hypothetical protein Krac_6577 [Ktedonobacter racemifer DSM 44963]